MDGSLEEDLAALRKLRDDDASGALKEFFGDGEDPREWTDCDGYKIVEVADGRVTASSALVECSSLAALPDAIGELKALTELVLYGCSSLAALPAAIGELKALTELDLPVLEPRRAAGRDRRARRADDARLVRLLEPRRAAGRDRRARRADDARLERASPRCRPRSEGSALSAGEVLELRHDANRRCGRDRSVFGTARTRRMVTCTKKPGHLWT